MPPSDEFDTIIQAVMADRPTLAAGHRPRRAHPVLGLAAGLGLFLVDAILVYVLVWFLRHG